MTQPNWTQLIKKLDREDALGVVASQPQQLEQKYAPVQLGDLSGIQQIVVAGMGGSALAAEFVQNWLGDQLPLPLVIARDYALPGFVGHKTLVVVSSYSGNTEETLAALAVAEERGAKIAVCTSGGKLLAAAQAKGYPFFELPGGYQPRLAVLYGVRALVNIIEQAGWLSGLVPELEAAVAKAKNELKAWLPQMPAEQNVAQQIAAQLVGHPIVVYGGPTLALATMKWKIDFNENAKNLAFYYHYSEFSHNEFQGWPHPAHSNLRVIELCSRLDHPQIQKRFVISNKLLAPYFEPIVINVRGETKLDQMLWAQLLGDFVSVYLAFLNGIDPTPVDLVEELKRELA